MAYMWLKEWQNAANDFSQVSKCGYDLWQGEYADFFTATNEKGNEMIFAIQYDEESGYCDNIQQAVGARDTYGGWDRVEPSSGSRGLGQTHGLAACRLLLPRRSEKQLRPLVAEDPGHQRLRSGHFRQVLPR